MKLSDSHRANAGHPPIEIAPGGSRPRFINLRHELFVVLFLLLSVAACRGFVSFF